MKNSLFSFPLIALAIALHSHAGGAMAFQPVEAGLQPLVDRQQAIVGEQHRLDQLLRSPHTQPQERAAAYRSHVAMELERLELECEIVQARRLATSPLVAYAASAQQASCGRPIVRN
jgi:hypothetical protein